MRCQLENVLVDCLRDTIHVMACLGSSEPARAVERSLKQCSLYSVFRAKSVDTVDELLRQVKSWHVAIVDEQCPLMSEIVSRLTACNSWIPVTLLSSSWPGRVVPSTPPPLLADSQDSPSSIAGGISERDAGAVTHNEHAVAVCGANNMGHLLCSVQEWSIKRKLLAKNPVGLVKEAMDVLFRKNPLSVDEWSSCMTVKPRRFQREFKQFTDLSPKKIIALYHAYRIAFDVVYGHIMRDRGVVPAYVVDTHSKGRVMEYVLTHRSSLLTAAY
jgi:hypothetical protein